MRILYYYSKLNIGGAERSTVRLLNEMSQKGHDVTLLLRWDGGNLENELNSMIKVVHLKKGNYDETTPLQYLIQARECLMMRKRIRSLKKSNFDIVISGLFGYDPSLLFKKVKAKQYYQMLRNDVSQTGSFGKTAQYMEKYGDGFDAYIGVSKYTTNSFCTVYPQYAKKARTIYNILPEIPESKWEKPIHYVDTDKIRIVTVCRMTDKAKGLFRMVHVCNELLRRHGDCFTWYVVGSGPDAKEMQKRINEAGLEKQMVLCGQTDNPFPYYAFADIVAVLSYYEGLCGVVNEAKTMNKPVISTKFSGIDEQIIDHHNGMIVENNQEAIVDGLSELLESKEMLSKYAINGMPEELLNNDRKIKQFENLFISIEGDKFNG